jgi:D-glycero-alpha-D-manno-heptose-7-phosphate kinase
MLDWVRDVEAAFLRMPTGTQDYCAALFGGVGAYTSKLGEVTRSDYADEVFSGLSQRLLFLFSGEMHQSGLSNWEVYKAALDANREVLGGLSALRDLSVRLDEQLNTSSIRWNLVGKFLSEEWLIRKSTFHVETTRLDEIVDFLEKRKVLGVKVCGAAQGGSLIALVEPQSLAAVREECSAHGITVLSTSLCKEGVGLEPSAATNR